MVGINQFQHKRNIPGPILVNFEKGQLMTILGSFKYFSEERSSQKIKVFLMKEFPFYLV